MKKLIIFIALLVLFAPNASALEQVFLGGVSIKFGDEKTEILQQLKKCNHVKECEDPKGLYIISNREDEYIGYVEFKDNQVIAVHKRWARYYENEGKKIIKALIGAISTLPESQKVAYVSTDRTISPDISIESISLLFGKRKIEISLIEEKDACIIQVDEYLRVSE